MIYLLNKNLINDKNFRVEVQKIHGIGSGKSVELCSKIFLHKNAKVKDVKVNKLFVVNKYIIENYKIGAELFSNIKNDLKKKVQIKSFKGMRFIYGLPMRGQKSKKNARTARRLHRVNILNVK